MISGSTRTQPGHIMITGLSKSGTTGVYTAVKRALSNTDVNAITLFEPRSAQVLDNVFLFAPHRTLLTKITIDKIARIAPDPLAFDRRVMTVRDPRDVLVSALLFRPLTRRSVLRCNPAVIDEFVTTLEAKEADPSSISVRELFALAHRLEIGAAPYDSLVRDLKRQRRLLKRLPFHVVRYEDLVSGDLTGLSGYLGTDVPAASRRSSATYGHIARSGSYGEYAQWFRADDVSFFDGILGDHVAALGYDRAANLAEHPSIDPAASSDYVRTRYQQRRERLAELSQHRERSWSPEEVRSTGEVDRLVTVAEDGDARACLRVAQIIGNDGVEALGGRSALDWVRMSAQLGLPKGIAAAIEMLEGSASDDPTIHREIRVWRQAEQFLAAQRDVQALRRSAGYRVGTQLVAVARSPRRNGRAAARELLAVWRERSAGRRQSAHDSGISKGLGTGK
jgi:hypothetical protein